MSKRKSKAAARRASRGGKGGMMRMRGGMQRAAGTKKGKEDATAKRWALVILGVILLVGLASFGV